MADDVLIIGAGTMGAGIAQVAAVAGWTARLRDVDAATAGAAIEGIGKRLDRLVEKGRMTAAERDAARGRLLVSATEDGLAGCSLVIEAVVEDLDVKASVLRALLAALPDDCVIATNTSSLSVTALGEAVGEPARTVGMHFFNPAPLLPLVEVIAGARTDPRIVDRVSAIAAAWGKRVARAADAPGFIVNHVARPFYLEAFRILEDGCAGPAEIDAAMTGLGGFRMGPLELTDLIGQDVNAATTRSVWERLDRPPLLRPSRLQEDLVRGGALGRKTGRGVYDYAGDEPVAAIETPRRPLPAGPAIEASARAFAEAATGRAGSALENYVFARILGALIVQAALARERGVAGKDDIDTALRYGTNYPLGPFEWAARIGPERCRRLLDALEKETRDGRFALPASLQATEGTTPCDATPRSSSCC